MPKRLATVSFAPDGRSVHAADRFGDVYKVAVPSLECDTPTAASPMSDDSAPLLGHFATMTDVAASETRIATCDREGRVRVSRYPDAHDIISFCLGHTSFVTRVAWISEGLLVSAGGDGTVRLWNADSGLQHAVLNVAGAESVVAGIAVIRSSPAAVAVFVHEEKEVVLLVGVEEKTLRVGGRILIKDGAGGAVTGVCVEGDGLLWVSTRSSTAVGCYQVSADGADLSFVRDVCLEVDCAGPGDSATPGEWLASLRKSKFDAEWKGKKRRREGPGPGVDSGQPAAQNDASP